MKRLLVGIGLVLAAALVAVICVFVLTDDEPVPAPPRPAPTPESPRRTPLEPVRRKPPPPPRAERRASPTPEHTGRLSVRLEIPERAPDPEGRELPPRLARITVLHPTGQELASLSGDGKNDLEFSGLPRRVPLVIRAEAEECLTGLCCDVVVPEEGQAAKSIAFVPAPIVAASVHGASGRLSGMGVVVYSGDHVVGEGRTDEYGVARIAVPIVGRLRVAKLGRPPQDGESVRVWPGDESLEVDLDAVRPADALEIEALDAAGKPVERVTVWIVGASDRPPSARTDLRGIASFVGFEANLKLAAVARMPDRTFARADFETRRAGAPQRVRLVLAQPAALVGDVVDPGGRALEGATVEVFMRPWGETIRARSEPSGRFETPPLPSGLARVTATCPGYLPWRSEQSVEIRPGVGGRVRAVLAPVPTGSLVVTARDDRGRPVADASILLAPSRREGRTGADGMCRIDGLPVGVVQTASARRGGLRMRLDDPAAPSVRVRADRAAGVDLTLTPSSRPEGRGPLSIRGVLLDGAAKPVVRARVEAAGSWCLSGMDGSFLVTGVAAPREGGPVELVLDPGPGLLERVVLPVDFDAEEEMNLREIRLRTRPYARIAVPRAGRDKDKRDRDRKRRLLVGPRPTACWVSFSHADELLGARTDRFAPRLVVSYDGTLLHLPPADDWQDEGRGEIFTATPAQAGLLAATASWTLAPDVAVVLRPAPAERPADVSVAAATEGDDRELRLEQIECGALFDPRAVHVPTGNERPPVDPFAALAEERVFVLPKFRTKTVVEGVAPGRWRASCGGLTETFSVPEESKVLLGR